MTLLRQVAGVASTAREGGMTLMRRIAVGFAGLVGLGCGSAEMITVPIGAPPRAPFTTDSIGYLARVIAGTRERGTYEFRIIARYENTTSLPVYFPKCRPESTAPLYSIALVGNRPGESAYNPIWPCTAPSDSIALAPGAMRIDTIVANAPNSWDGKTGEPFGVWEGRFVLRYSALWNCLDLATCRTPDSLWISNEFEVRVGR
jgi:hypothetical protein